MAYADIARVLDGARRRQIRVVLLAALAFGLAAGLLALFTGAAALALGARPVARALALAGGGTAVAAALVFAIRALVRTAWSDHAVARTLARDEPALRSDLLSSVELARERDDVQATGRFSVALLDAHVARTGERARGVDLDRAIPDRWARVGGLALLGVAVLHGATFIIAGAPFARAYGRIVAGDPGAPSVAPVDPITGDIELTYRYPAYMNREPRTLSGTGGEVRAPRGTEVAVRTRADRAVKAAEIVIELADAVRPSTPGRSAPLRSGRTEELPLDAKRFALKVSGDRDLSGTFVVEEGGSYRFRFLDPRGHVVAEGPAIPIAIEPDLPPEVRITSPEREIEVDAGAVVHVEWQAEDDVGLEEVALVVAPADGAEKRRVLRKGGSVRRDGGTAELDLAPEKLGEGEQLTYRIEATDGDVVSGPKQGVSETHVIKIYSEAEHRRAALERAREVFEETVKLLADRLESLQPVPVWTPDRHALAEQLDVRTRALHERMRDVAREIRKDRAGPREIAVALENVAGHLRVAEQRVVATRTPVAQAFRIRTKPDVSLVRTMVAFDGQLDQELEKGILYLEQLLDKQRAEDLVRLAKELSEKRRTLADLLEKYRASPTEQGKKELLARISRMKDRLKELLARMAEMSRGFNDEHMNAEALAEMAKSQDLAGGLDDVEKLLAKGDVEGAMKALDRMASSMDQLLAGMRRNAGVPDEKARALMKEMLAFKEQIDKVKRDQERTAADTEKIRARYRDALKKRMKDAEQRISRLEKLASEARRDVDAAQPGVTYRAEPEYQQAHESLADLERALGMKELGAAYEMSQRAAPAVERLARFLEEDEALARHNPLMTKRGPEQVEDAQRNAVRAVPKVREIRDELAKLFPDPRSVLGQGDQKKLEELSKRQSELEQDAAGLQRQLAELMQKAPVFPQGAPQQLGESRGHMNQAASQLGQKNPQRGRGEQELALEALSRFQKGLEEAAKKGGGGQGQGFPFPFADSGGSDEESGDGMEPSREKVAIPGAEAHRVPEEFRKDLLEAMKQGTPERYRGEVQRYYEELVK